MSGGTAFSSDPLSQLEILGHESDALGVDREQVGIFKERGEVALSGFLKGSQGVGGEANIWSSAASDVSDESLEREARDDHFALRLQPFDFL